MYIEHFVLPVLTLIIAIVPIFVAPKKKMLTCLFLCLYYFFLVASPLTLAAGQADFQKLEGEQEKNGKIEYILSQAKAYQKAKKFDEAQKLLSEALKEFKNKEHQKQLHIEIADVHFLWAVNLGKKYEYSKSLKHFEVAYGIDKMYRPQDSANDLYNIALVYFALGKKHKALEHFEKALPIWQSVVDPEGETKTLNNIGFLYSAFGQKHKALEYYKKALPICQEMGDGAMEGRIMNGIGCVYSDIGQKQKAMEYFEKALPICQSVGDRVEEVNTLNNMGAVYFDLGQTHKALEYFEKALLIWQSMGDRRGAANTLDNIGIVYFALGQTHKALKYYEKALTISKALGDWEGEAITTSNIGSVYNALGQKKKALEYYQKALTIQQILGDKRGIATTLNNIGAVYNALNRNYKALEYYQKALTIIQSVEDRAGEAATLNNIGFVYYVLGQTYNALEYYKKAIIILREVGDLATEAATLNNIGRVHSVLGQKHKALQYYEKAVPIMRAVGYQTNEAYTLSNLMTSWESLKKIRLSIFFGKQSVNVFQLLRSNISGIEKKVQISYVESQKNHYRRLVALLIPTGRLSEAQQVLDMLKKQEFFEFIRRDRSSADALSTQVDYTKFEKQWLVKYNTILKKFSSIISEYHVLKMKRNETEEKRMQELDLKLKQAQKEYQEFLVQLKEAFDKHEQDIIAGRIAPAALAKEASKLQTTIKYLDETEGNKNAALHYLVYEGRISVILTTPSSQSVKQTEIDEKEFNVMIVNYRNLILNLGKIKRGVQPLETSNDRVKKLFQKKKEYEKKLYDAIFKPVDEELKKYGATNLTISLDGVLRYIPLAALWDGESYLAQRYRMAIVTPSSLKNIKDEAVKERKILGFGASRGGQGFAFLPHVGREIRSIVRDEEKGYYGLIKGKAFIDNDFTKDTMVSQLKNRKYPLVHISSHFKFSPGDETKNHLLLGDGTTMKLSEIRRMGKLFDNVKLLVLSACQTGVGGNGEEIDGFGELAQQSGAKSVIASLWPVADESTKELMVTFYRKLKEGRVTSKIEALRQAQLELAGLEDLLQKDGSIGKQSSRQRTKYASSYYWGPFIMIGNWR